MMSAEMTEQRPEAPRRRDSILDSADNVLRVLLMLRRDGVVRVSGVAAELGVAVSTAHRLLATLRYRGFVVQARGHEYVPGPAMGTMSRPEHRWRIAGPVRQAMQELSLRVRETVNLMVLVGADTQVADSIESPSELRVRSRVGYVVPARLSAGGRAMLAEISPGDVDRLHRDLDPASPELARLHLELARTRQRGYGLNMAESNADLVAVGMVLHQQDGRPAGALSIATPVDRFRREQLPAQVAALRATIASVRGVIG